MGSHGSSFSQPRHACQLIGRSLVDRVLAGISPWRCVLCREAAAGMDLCMGCLEDLPWLGELCRHCGTPLASDVARICGGCLQRKPVADVVEVALAYEYPVVQMITAMKYQRDVVYARVLGELLVIRLQEQFATGSYPQPDVLLPVPLHPWRQLRRSFNQSALLAACLAREFGMPVESGWISRSRNTPSQTGLSRNGRRKNMHGCFAASKVLEGKRVAIIDDVITTGATVMELARVVRQAGAQHVQVWACAKVV
jgi:ComF family protein